jgi:hypothetical protein
MKEFRENTCLAGWKYRFTNKRLKIYTSFQFILALNPGVSLLIFPSSK